MTAVKTHESGRGFARDSKTELFLRATTMFAGQDTFYENADQADARAVSLARDLAVHDWNWFAPFLKWLRSDGNIRTMSSILAVEGVKARLAAEPETHFNSLLEGTGIEMPLSHRQLIDSVLQRPDEPGKMLQYHFEHYGKDVPKPIKRGIADALVRMLNQRQALRYDKPGDTVRLGDVIEFTHPSPKDEVQDALFKHLITNRHDREGYVPPEILAEVRARWELMQLAPDARHAFAVEVQAGDADAVRVWRDALAGSWEWGKLWLGEK